MSTWWSDRTANPAGTKRRRAARLRAKRSPLGVERLDDRTLLSLGTLDPGFGVSGKVTTDLGSLTDQARSIWIESNGGILVAGSTSNGANSDFAVVRYNAGGAVDSSFGMLGKVTTDFSAGDDFATGISVDSQGRIVVAGFSLQAGIGDFAVARYLANGTPDASFGAGGSGKTTTDFATNDDRAAALVLQPDGKIVVVGVSRAAAVGDFALARFNSDGTLDGDFDADGKVTTTFAASDDEATGVVIQSDLRIVVAGSTDVGGTKDFAIVRYNSDGSVDSDYGTSGAVVTDFAASEDVTSAMTLDTNNRVLVAGFSSSGGGGENFALARYNVDGTPDMSFSGDGRLTTDFALGNDRANALAIGPNGKILVAGQSATGNAFALASYTPNGSLDARFGSGGQVLTSIGLASSDAAAAIAVQSDGRIVVAGTSTTAGNSDVVLARYTAEAPDILVTGADRNVEPRVHVFDVHTGIEVGSFLPFAATFRGGVRVAAGDLSGDGVPDIVVAPGPGMKPLVGAIDGATGLPLPGAIGGFLAYDARFRGGVYVAVGDVNGDGVLDIITGPGSGMEPRVRVFSGAGGGVLASFLAENAKFRGGIRVAAGDTDGDGRAEIITGAGRGGVPNVSVMDGITGVPVPGPAGRFVAFNPAYRGGVFVATGDVDGDGRADILVGAGAVSPRTKVFRGLDAAQVADFLAFDAGFKGGVRVATADLDGDGTQEIIVGSGPGRGPFVRIIGTFGEIRSFFAGAGFNHGVFVSASRAL